MANRILPDSNYYINASRAGLDPFAELGAHSDDWEFFVCGMVVLEVCRGRAYPNVVQRFRERFAIMPCVPTSASIWERAERLAWTLDRRGELLPAPDLLIAACALQIEAAVLTADAHFQKIPGLRVLTALP